MGSLCIFNLGFLNRGACGCVLWMFLFCVIGYNGEVKVSKQTCTKHYLVKFLANIAQNII